MGSSMFSDKKPNPSERHRIVILGGGFGGLCAARDLGRAPAEITLVDRRNHHLFQPLLYQVATGGLSPANIAAPLRGLFKRSKNLRVILGEVVDFDLEDRRVLLEDGTELPYDTLIVATGATSTYFGNDDWQRMAPSLKTLEDARRIRQRMLLAFERAERETDPAKRRAELTFAVIGGGPTGVELAGALAEVAYRTLVGEFRRIDPKEARILLIEGIDRLLPAFEPELSERAKRDLEGLGVEVRLDSMVEDVRPAELDVKTGEKVETLAAENVIWAAGVTASPLGRKLADQANLETDRGGRLSVEPDCTLPGHPEIFVIGDLARHEHGEDGPLPGLAPVAMQQGRYVAKLIGRRLAGKSLPGPFRYLDKGNMATIGRKLAVAEIWRLRFGGLFAWLAWLFVHLMYLAEFQNRVLVLVQWAWNYITRNRSARLISEEPET